MSNRKGRKKKAMTGQFYCLGCRIDSEYATDGATLIARYATCMKAPDCHMTVWHRILDLKIDVFSALQAYYKEADKVNVVGRPNVLEEYCDTLNQLRADLDKIATSLASIKTEDAAP